MRRRVVGSSPVQEDAIKAPRDVDLQRDCDFCGVPPTTHWLTFDPAVRGVPAYLGACTSCAESLDFRDPKQLARESDLVKDEAKAIAKGFKAIELGGS